MGFEPTPPKRLVPETSALDRSAIQPMLLHEVGQWVRRCTCGSEMVENGRFGYIIGGKKVPCAGRESNPGLVRGRDVYYHCTTGASIRTRI